MAWNNWSRKRNKFGAIRTEREGRSFASKLEAKLFSDLRLREDAGELRNLKCQPQVHLLGRRILIIPDFCAEEYPTWELVYFEAKGFSQATWVLKRKVWEYCGPAKLYVYKGSERRVFLDQTIVPEVSPDLLP